MQRYVPFVAALVVVGFGGFVYGRMTNVSTPVHAEDGLPKQTIVYSEGEEPVSAHFDFSGGEPLPSPEPPVATSGITEALSSDESLVGATFTLEGIGKMYEFLAGGRYIDGMEFARGWRLSTPFNGEWAEIELKDPGAKGEWEYYVVRVTPIDARRANTQLFHLVRVGGDWKRTERRDRDFVLTFTRT